METGTQSVENRFRLCLSGNLPLLPFTNFCFQMRETVQGIVNGLPFFGCAAMDSPRQRRRGVLTDRLSKEHLSCLRLKIRGFQRNPSENSCSRSGLRFDLQAAVYYLKSLSHADQSETLPRETFVFIETFPVIRHR